MGKKANYSLVTGIVVLLIGLTLIKEGLISMGGGYQAMQDHTFASADNLIMSCTVLAIIIVLNRIRIVWIKSSAILIALVIGYILAGFMGYLNLWSKDAPVIQIPTYRCIWLKLLMGLIYSNGIYLFGYVFRSN